MGVVEAHMECQRQEHGQQHPVLDRVDRRASRAREPSARRQPVGGRTVEPRDGELVHPETSGCDLHEAECTDQPAAHGESPDEGVEPAAFIDAVMRQQQRTGPGDERQDRNVRWAALVRTHRTRHGEDITDADAEQEDT